jgi:hypothetical protein
VNYTVSDYHKVNPEASNLRIYLNFVHTLISLSMVHPMEISEYITSVLPYDAAGETFL